MPRPIQRFAAFFAVYVLWGSTYLAIRYGVETLPPFLLTSVRNLTAGGILTLAAFATGAARPTRAEWLRCALVGLMLIGVGNGLVVWASQILPSTLTALMIAMAPLWFTLLSWTFNDMRPSRQGLAGVLVGFGGIALLVGPVEGAGSRAIDPLAGLALLVASISWAGGSLLARSFQLPASRMMATGMQMLAGGTICALVSFVTGEPARFDPATVSVASAQALLYLVVFGSLIGFTAYSWLIDEVTPAQLSTYAYVNPVVAILLGTTLGGEPFTPRMALAATVIVTGVLMMTRAPKASRIVKAAEDVPAQPAALRAFSKS